jgi:hypothetical protein
VIWFEPPSRFDVNPHWKRLWFGDVEESKVINAKLERLLDVNISSETTESSKGEYEERNGGYGEEKTEEGK